MHKYFSIFAFPILAFLMMGTRSHAATIVVCATCTEKQLAPALEKACDGDTLIIRKGIYPVNAMIIDKSLTIIGKDYPILDGMSKGPILIVTANHVHIEGLHLRKTGISHVQDWAAIRLKKVAHFVIINNKVEDTCFGIYLEHSRSGIIRGNEIYGKAKFEASSGNGIHLWYCKHIQVEKNTIRGHRDGIYLEFTDSSRMAFNIAENNLRYGLHFMFSNDDDYFKNTFSRNGAGVAVMFSKKINMWENTFSANWGQAAYGLLLKEITDAEIRDNLFHENTIGIFVEGTNRMVYARNTFSRNGWAIKMSGGCLENKISGNNFLQNTFDLSVHSGANNDFDGNYWSGYDGYDLNRDGIGDIPYRPVKLFNYIVNRTPEAMILLRSLFVDLLNLTEKVSPVFTPENVADNQPLMKPILLTTRPVNSKP